MYGWTRKKQVPINYQFWLNTSDEDAAQYIKKFTLFSREEVEALITEHQQAPHIRMLQKALAKDITIRVHSEDDYHAAVEASEILFGKGTNESLKKLSEETLLSVFEGVPQCEITVSDLNSGIGIIDFLSHKTGIFSSNGEARRMLKEGGVQVNKQKAAEDLLVNNTFLLNNKYMLVQKGKKNYYLVIVK